MIGYNTQRAKMSLETDNDDSELKVRCSYANLMLTTDLCAFSRTMK